MMGTLWCEPVGFWDGLFLSKGLCSARSKEHPERGGCRINYFKFVLTPLSIPDLYLVHTQRMRFKRAPFCADDLMLSHFLHVQR
jgi:hypothetical protein